MRLPAVLLSCTHRALCWLAGLTAAGLALAAGVAALMVFWVLPNIDDHRETVAALLSRALGQRVTLEAVSGSWQQARPEFRLQGVRLYDRQGRPALELPELQAGFAWRSLLFFEPRFNRIELRGLVLGVRRAPDRHIYIGGIPVNPEAPDSGFVNWLLRQGRVHVGGATLVWQDGLRGAPPLLLQDVELTLANVRQTHTLELRMVPPASLARPLTIHATLNARKTDALASWRGSLEASVAGVALPSLGTWVALPVDIKRGWGALKLTFGVEGGRIARAQAAMDLREFEATLGEGLAPLNLTQVRGTAEWARLGDRRQRLRFENLRVTRADAADSDPFDIGLTWDADTREITARGLNLASWETMLPSLPMDDGLRARLQALQPQGRFDSLRLGWRGEQPGLDNFSVSAHFSGLGVRSVDDQPGGHNLSGRIEGDREAGRFELDSKALVVNLPATFREPAFGFDALSARGGWKKTSAGLKVRIDQGAFVNADMQGTLSGDYEWIAGQPGVADLTLQLRHGEATAVHRYLPRRIGDMTVSWLRKAVIAGHSDGATIRIQGDLRHFPFDEGKGVFRADVRLRDVVLEYVTGWPRIEGIEAQVLFEGRRMDVNARTARVFGATLSSVKAVIPDLLHHEEILHVEGQANGPVQDFIRFANDSPVGTRLRGFTEGVGGTGPIRLTLELTVPLRHSRDTTLAGRLSFLGDSLVPPAHPRLDQVRGDIDFTHERVTAHGITAQFLGGPLRIDADTLPGKVSIRAQGSATAAGLGAWLGPALGERLTGQAAWRGELELTGDGTRLRVESSLAGLGSSLPAPLAKPAGVSLPLQITVQPREAGRRVEMLAGTRVGAVWQTTATGDWQRGEIRLGGAATLPNEAGLRVVGRGEMLDLGGWMALLPEAGAGQGLSLSALDLTLDSLELMGRRFDDLHVQGRMRNGLLRGQVDGRGVAGVLTYKPPGASGARLSAQFSKFVIPPGKSTPGGAGPRVLQAENFPTLDLTVEAFYLDDRPLGRLDVVARGTPQGMLIDSLKLAHEDSELHMSGLWRDGVPSETRAELKLSVSDAGKFLARFGYPGVMARGSAEFQGVATWVGSPADFAFDSLAGQIAFKAKAGQFLKVDPGVGKLLGVLSLQSLPRRLSFDFRDIFNQGYAFDDARATLRIARGVIYSDDFQMRGPAAKVSMSGLADLNAERVQLRVKVIPKLSESVAVAGALLGGPIVGVGTLAAQKLLRDPFEEIVSREYLVSGPWQTPDVKPLPKLKNESPSGPQMSEPSQ